MNLLFKSMRLSEDNVTVEIMSEYRQHHIPVRLSILQLAKAFGTDTDAVQNAEDNFGSGELEEACQETREAIEAFPKASSKGNEIECVDIHVRTNGQDRTTIILSAEDLAGWENEGVYITMPIPLYERELEGKKYTFILTGQQIRLE